MDTDLILVIGMVLCLLAVPMLLSAYVERRLSRSGLAFVFIGGVLILVALTQNPYGYSFAGIPNVVFTVIGRYLN
jgi:hypothetical protein